MVYGVALMTTIKSGGAYQDGLALLNEPSVLELAHAVEAARIFDVHRGWLKQPSL
jgi:hypothetical protein